MKNISIIDKIKSFRIIKKQPDGDWRSIVFIMIILIFISLLWNGYFYLEVRSDIDDTYKTTNVPASNPLGDSSQEINLIMDDYEKKRIFTEMIGEGQVEAVPDPSVF
jgi:hypothetical protein